MGSSHGGRGVAVHSTSRSPLPRHFWALLAPRMPAGHKINAPLAQQGHRGKGAKDAVAHHIPGCQGRPQAVEERLIMVHEGPQV